MDMPEEINRILTDRISNALFGPTDAAIENLESVGFAIINSWIVKNGDLMKDAALFYLNKESLNILFRQNLYCVQYFVQKIQKIPFD